MALLHIVGVSHRTAPIEIREALAFARDSLAEALQRLREETGAAEAMILSTCNRVEVYARCERADAAEALEGFLCAFHQREAAALSGNLYRISGEQAVLHAFRVASSLDSMVIGEPQILGQV